MTAFTFIRTADGMVIARGTVSGLTASGSTLDEALAELRRLLSNGRSCMAPNSGSEIETAWNEWLALRQKALGTGDLADGIASGKAFGRFHNLFVEPEGRQFADVIPLRGVQS
ncbi:hypothetical protein [Mesorhizobium sp. B2-3-4]|uniref:hypothetical protein n=1 Tax=Mesorhizobium sp. B2-3-4 TaxID=2589959 RepID=UPI00112B3660|nr:hypothetical protein [Mesorhizobium sp. B2-3-4]TPM25691.1 hypothetical protein FJ967_32200 [Mesorhizobium sp. B2-3-4]